jgi:SnoaL-like domain
VHAADAARRWASTWQRAWPERDIEAIVALYAEGVEYRALAFRSPEVGPEGVRAYLSREFGVEDDIACRFGTPVTSGERSAVEWWASWVEEGQPITLAGSTFLRFDATGLVIDHRDYWSHVDAIQPPHEGW